MKAFCKAAAAVFFFACGPARAEPVCAPYGVFAEVLTDDFGQQPMLAGIRSKGGVMEIWTRPDGETWTAIILAPDGTACMVDGGVSLMPAPPLPKPDDPA